MASRVWLGVGAALFLIAGFVVGYFVGCTGDDDDTQKPETPALDSDVLTRDANDTWFDVMVNGINADNIRENLRWLTSRPHIAGSAQSRMQAEHLASLWKQQGMTSRVSPYDVMLSFPDPETPNKVELQDGSGNVLFTSQLYEKILRPEQNQSDVIPPFNAYCSPGTPKGELIYVNYGTIDDFTWLNDVMNINFTGRICIARYGRIARGDKARHAAQFGAAGLVLFSDPADYARGGTVYPDSWWLPGTGVQRGSLWIAGDPQTPGYPSIDSAYRVDESDLNTVPIPVHPIGYDDAWHLLSVMSGEAAPADWQGGLNFTYRIGPGFTRSDLRVQMFVSTHLQRARVYNAFGIIEGAIEPDRYVLLGNHRDAWVFGAVDPSSGTATMMELSRVLGGMLKQGWRPRRTVILCSWAAEEQSLIGSREFVEEYRAMLSSRAVAYLNVDLVLSGMDCFDVRALPMLANTARQIAKKIVNPIESQRKRGHMTLYDGWLQCNPELDDAGQPTDRPKVGILGSGSDYEAFIVQTGVTSADMRFRFPPSSGLSSYPLYHSVYETFHLVDEIMDPGFKLHKATAEYWGEMTRRLADDYVLPFNVTDYVVALESYTQQLLNIYEPQLQRHNMTSALGYWREALEELKTAAHGFEHRLQKHLDRRNPLAVRSLNDQILELERVFIDPLGLPDRKFTRHVVFAPSAHDVYAGVSFPGVSDALWEAERSTGSAQEVEKRWEQVRQQVSVITYVIHAAAQTLNKPAQL